VAPAGNSPILYRYLLPSYPTLQVSGKCRIHNALYTSRCTKRLILRRLLDYKIPEDTTPTLQDTTPTLLQSNPDYDSTSCSCFVTEYPPQTRWRSPHNISPTTPAQITTTSKIQTNLLRNIMLCSPVGFCWVTEPRCLFC